MRLISAAADFNAAVLFFLPALPWQLFPLEGFDFFCRTSTLPGLWPGFFLFRSIPVVSGLLARSSRSRISTLVRAPLEAVKLMLAHGFGGLPRHSRSMAVFRAVLCTALLANSLPKCLFYEVVQRDKAAS